MYITKADYRGRISTDLLDMIIAEDPIGIISNASKDAEDTISSLAGVEYNVADELLKAGTDRNFFVRTMAINIALYHLYQIADDEAVPEKVIKNYDDTISDLTKISNGKMSLSLPQNTGSAPGTTGTEENASTTGYGLRRMGSAAKRTHYI